MSEAAKHLRARFPWPPEGLGEMLRLAGPVIMARLGVMVMGLVDAVVVGRYSAEQLGYHALGWAPTIAILMGAIGLLVGVQVKTAQYIGEGRRGETGGIYRRGMVYAFWVGAAAAALLIAFGPAFLHVIGLERGLADGASWPLRIFALSMPVYLMGVAASFYLEALGRPKAGMAITWIGNGVNLGLNLLLVPGVGDIPAFGAVGSAWSTFGSRLFLTLALIVYIARLKEARSLGVFTKPADGKAAAVEQRRIGYAAGISYFVEGGSFAVLSIVAGWLGAQAVAAWAVVINVTSLIFMIPLGLSTATAVLVGRAYGAGDRRAVTRAGVMGFWVSAAASVIVMAVVW
ncbi:MAG: MATE family efflux transporter, partial [Caulobacteraceae bacterium]